jgi:hypothetical protein
MGIYCVKAKKKRDRMARTLMLWARLNQHRMQYTPLSHRGMRARRLIPKLHAILAGGAL